MVRYRVMSCFSGLFVVGCIVLSSLAITFDVCFIISSGLAMIKSSENKNEEYNHSLLLSKPLK